MSSLITALVLGAAVTQGYIVNGTDTVVIPGATSYNGLNLVPQMGWDNWNAFGCDVSEELLLSTAQSMVDFGLRDAGYNYVVLDDCWSIGRNTSGFLESNPLKFPNGMGYIADQLHGMGMKFGMYSSAGIFTCGKYPGSLGKETKDAEYFAANGVDYLKCMFQKRASVTLC
jgi:alpha-galactosidase